MAVRGFACILLLLISGLTAGCAAPGNGWQTVAFAAQPNAYGLPLEAVWNATVAASGVDNRTAVLDQCWIDLDEEGSLESVLLYYFGVVEGAEQFCSARYLPERAKISVCQGNTTITAVSASGPHPLAVLTAIEDLPFREIAFGEEGLAIFAESQSGGLGYKAEYSDLFLLENGTLEPLGEVAFSTERPWYTIIVSRRAAPDLVMTEGDTTVVVYQASTVPEPPGQRSSFTVFTPDELTKAETVVRDCPTVSVGIASGNTTVAVQPAGRYVVHWYNGDGAEVWFDGEYRGAIDGTSLTVKVDPAVPPFVHYSVRSEGSAAYTGCITAVPEPGETTDLFPQNIVTEPPPPGAAGNNAGWYVIHPHDEGASVYVDGRYIGDGEVRVPENATSPPYERFRVVDPDGSGYTVTFSTAPPPGGEVHYYPWVQPAPYWSPAPSTAFSG